MLTVKADFLDVDIDPVASRPDESDTDVFNVGGLSMPATSLGDGRFIEPQASLAVVHTEIDDLRHFRRHGRL